MTNEQIAHDLAVAITAKNLEYKALNQYDTAAEAAYKMYKGLFTAILKAGDNK